MSEPLPQHYASPQQLSDATAAGMWAFLATEAMVFGALFISYAAFRLWFPQAFAAGSAKLHIGLGTLNTGLLLTSSLFMVLADRATRLRQRQPALLLLVLTAAFGLLFLGIKFYEWYLEYQDHLVPLRGLSFQPPSGAEPQFQVFFSFYYIATGLHALHMGIGLGILAAMLLYTWRWREPARVARRVAAAGLYWHFVDIVWVFLYPILYLV